MARIVAVIVSAAFIVAVIVWGSFALYEGSWDLAKHNVQHSLQIQQQQANGQASIAANGWNYQTMLGQEITKGIQNVTDDSTSIIQAGNNPNVVSQLKSQREADANTVCDEATQINGSLPQGQYQTKWIAANCQDGNVKTTSPYYYNGTQF